MFSLLLVRVVQMDAIKVKALGVRGAFVTSRSANATDASDALSIVLQFDDARMATNVKRHFAERVQVRVFLKIDRMRAPAHLTRSLPCVDVRI